MMENNTEVDFLEWESFIKQNGEFGILVFSSVEWLNTI